MGWLACEAGCAACAADPAAPPAGQRARLPAQAVRHAPAQLGKVYALYSITPELVFIYTKKTKTCDTKSRIHELYNFVEVSLA